MHYEQFREYFQQYFYYFLIGQLIFGAVVGAIPLLVGIRRNQRNLGLIAFGVSVLLATVSPLLCVIIVIVFVVFVLKKPAVDTSAEVRVNGQEPADVSVKDSLDN